MKLIRPSRTPRTAHRRRPARNPPRQGRLEIRADRLRQVGVADPQEPLRGDEAGEEPTLRRLPRRHRRLRRRRDRPRLSTPRLHHRMQTREREGRDLATRILLRRRALRPARRLGEQRRPERARRLPVPEGRRAAPAQAAAGRRPPPTGRGHPARDPAEHVRRPDRPDRDHPQEDDGGPPR